MLIPELVHILVNKVLYCTDTFLNDGLASITNKRLSCCPRLLSSAVAGFKGVFQSVHICFMEIPRSLELLNSILIKVSAVVGLGADFRFCFVFSRF